MLLLVVVWIVGCGGSKEPETAGNEANADSAAPTTDLGAASTDSEKQDLADQDAADQSNNGTVVEDVSSPAEAPAEASSPDDPPKPTEAQDPPTAAVPVFTVPFGDDTGETVIEDDADEED
jgi:cytoskeletal protein RodZ